MQKGTDSEFLVLKKIERLVCFCVNMAIPSYLAGRYNHVFTDTLYKGVTNIPITRSIARGAVFSIAHDKFGINYKDIEKRSGITLRNIMKSSRRFKDSQTFDKFVDKVKKLIDVELQKFPII